MAKSLFMPVKVLYGKGCVLENSAEFSKLGKKALIVTTPSSARNGSRADVIAALEKEGMTYEVYDRCENNPSLAMANDLGDFARKSGCDLVIGIGGGSAMDSAKAATVLAVNDMPAEELFKNVYPNGLLPLITVPTTSGTGAEVTYNSVLTIDGGTNKKSFGDTRNFAKVAFLDASYTESMPMKLTRFTALDALAHALEGYLSSKASPAGTMVDLEIFRIFAANYKSLLGDSLTYEEREQLQLAAMYSGISIALERTIALHSISYPLTAIKGVHHGQAVALPMAAFVEVCYLGAKERIDALLKIFGLKEVSELKGYIGALLDDPNTYTREEVERFVGICGKGACGRNNPVQLTIEDITNIYLKSLNMVD